MADKYSEIGRQAIESVTPILQAVSYNNTVFSPTGSTLEPDLQRMGIDLLFWSSPDRLLTVEVKGTPKSYTSAFLELSADLYRNRPGWMFTVKSDLLIWVYLDDGIVYMMAFHQLYNWYMDNYHRYELRQQLQHDTQTATFGCIIPWRDICIGLGKRHFGTYRLYDDQSVWMEKASDMHIIPPNKPHTLGVLSLIHI